VRKYTRRKAFTSLQMAFGSKRAMLNDMWRSEAGSEIEMWIDGEGADGRRLSIRSCVRADVLCFPVGLNAWLADADRSTAACVPMKRAIFPAKGDLGSGDSSARLAPHVGLSADT
jgi:hypothetical protein